MNHFSMKLQRLFLTLALCVAGVAVSASVFAFAQSGGEDPIVYLPVIAGPPDNVGGGTLDNGGTVIGPDGVGIGAFTDTLDAPIMVTISRTIAPPTALPSQAQMLGEFYEISAGEDVYVVTESPFILAFPVPPGAGTDHLALAMLTSGDHVNDAEPGVQAWTMLEGVFDPDQNLFLTTIAGLHNEGNPLVLVTHPDVDSPPNAAAASAGVGVPRRGQFDLFNVKCQHFIAANACTETIESDVETTLELIYLRIQQDLGFFEPRLRYLDETLHYNPNSLSSLGYTVYVHPDDYGYCANLGGYYSPHTGELVLCMDPATGLDPNYIFILIHEYFHATEFAYYPVLDDYLNGAAEDWIIEGMATAAEKSAAYDDQMVRSDVDSWLKLHKVDVSLMFGSATNLPEPDLDPYFAQDFWVFYGLNNGLGLGYLQDVLVVGAKTEDVVNVLGDGDYLDAYWDWAKNQVMEKAINFDGVLQSPCFVEEQVVEEFEIFELQWTDNLYHQLTVGPLSTAVVKLTFSDVHDFAFGWVYGHVQDQLPDAEMALKYKFYEDGENGCEAVPDGPRTWPEGEGVAPGKTYYVVISNTDYDAAYDYTITFELAFPD